MAELVGFRFKTRDELAKEMDRLRREGLPLSQLDWLEVNDPVAHERFIRHVRRMFADIERDRSANDKIEPP